MSKIKKTITITLSIIIIILLILGIAFISLKIKTDAICDDYNYVLTDEKYKKPVSVNKIALKTQEITCGYAVMEMFGYFSGENVTENSLMDKYGKIVTSKGKNFVRVMNENFKGFNTTMYKYLKSSDLLVAIYKSIENGIPVPFEWCAKNNGEWTLHYSLITAVDFKNDIITVNNPYGLIEKVSVEEFISRTTFKAFEKMPLFLKFAFAFGGFEKNTIFIPKKI